MIENIINSQKKYFKTGQTRDIDFRIKQLKKLKKIISARQEDIMQAISEDTFRPDTEIYTSEIYTLLNELELFIKKTKKWVRPRKVRTPVMLKPGKSRVLLQPLGTVLIMAPWNYPFQLLFTPLIGAMAAGNCAVVKPSEISSKTAAVISDIIKEAFSSEYICCVEGGADIARELVKGDFDHIFFTGSEKIGRSVMKAAAENLVPVTLELGGKCPCIVSRDAPIKKSARRIAWGKFFNAGQTCLAPDYVLAHASVKEELIGELEACIKKFYGSEPAKSNDYGRIINRKYFDRLVKLAEGKIAEGFNVDRENLYIPPTILRDVSPDDDIMKTEIFGPLLPVLEYEKLADAASFLRSLPRPLIIYLFTREKKNIKEIKKNTSSGSIIVNDVLIQGASPYLPFGGVGKSGMGRYRGKNSLLTFSNRRSFVTRSFFPDIKFRYPPYKTAIGRLKKYLRLLR